jgi:hypothetical protein
MEKARVIDLASVDIKPTWEINRIGSEVVSKHLNRFLWHEDICKQAERYRTWVGRTWFSNHSLIVLEMEGDIENPKAPFKYNLAWSKEEDLRGIINSHWKHYDQNDQT